MPRTQEFMTTGNKLKTLRKSATPPLTQVELAARLGVAQRWVSDLENDRVKLTRRLVISYANYFKIGAIKLAKELRFPPAKLPQKL